MREAPTFAAPVQQGVVGDDPLGLAATSQRLYNSAFPGFNNYVRYIRVYAALCWMAHQVHKTLEKDGAEDSRAAKKLFDEALQKMELALVWANPSAAAVAGKERKRPEQGDVNYVFTPYGQIGARLFGSPYYKPSLTTGLSFLGKRKHQIYGCLPDGVDLAEAYDLVLRGLPGYRWLKAPHQVTGRRRYVEDLGPALDLEKPSEAEQAAFLRVFFPDAVVQEVRPHARARWLTLQLMLRSVGAVCEAHRQAGEPSRATPQEIRACMARGRATNGAVVVEDEVRRVQAWWAVLQLRQLQRMCMEALYCVVERWIARCEIDGTNSSVERCAVEVSAMASSKLEVAVRGKVERMSHYLAQLQGAHPSLYEAAAAWRPAGDDDENEADVLTQLGWARDREALKFEDDGCLAVAQAYEGLVFCARETQNLSANLEAHAALQADRDACSLLRLAKLVERFKTESLEAFLAHFLKEWVILRHFAVVGSRSMRMDGKNRFRFVVGDYGLERFDKTAGLPLPSVSADKLDRALDLCAQAGLLSESRGAFALTAAGRRRIAR